MNLADNLGVKVVYRDREKKPVYTKAYTLREYTDMLRADLLRIVTDVEDMCYAVNQNAPKEDWSDETFSGFNKIKHKILDKAGDIGRLPDNLREQPESLTGFIARIIEEGDDGHGEGSMGQNCGYQKRG